MTDYMDLIQIIVGISAGLITGNRYGKNKARKVIKVFVDTINEVGSIIGEDNKKRVKKSVQMNSTKIGMNKDVHKAVKKAEKSKNAQ